MIYTPFRRFTMMTTMTVPTKIVKITAATTPPISPPLMLSDDEESIDCAFCSFVCVVLCSVPDTIIIRNFTYNQKVFTIHCYIKLELKIPI